MAILNQLLEFIASVALVATSEVSKKLLPRNKCTKEIVTYGSTNEMKITYSKVDKDETEQCIHEEHTANEQATTMERPLLAQKVKRSLRGSFVITLVTGLFPLGISAIILVYLNLNSSNLCFKWSNEEDKLLTGVRVVKFFSDEVETMIINLWFPLTLSIFFGFSVFMTKHFKAVTICLVVGLLTVLYKAILFASGLYHRKLYYNVPSNVLFSFGVIYGSHVVAQEIRKEHPDAPRITSWVKLSIQFILGGITCFTLTYVIVPWFNDLQNEREKVVAAAFAPSTALLPKTISLYFAGKAVVGLTTPERSFILAWFPHGVGVIVFRIMQSDLKSLHIFIGLCVFNGVANIIINATVKLRKKFWILVLRMLTKICCCGMKPEVTPRCLPCEQSLNADIIIQTMLCEITSMITCQAYFAFYIVTNFQVSKWPVFKDFFVRISFAFGFDFISNFLSIFVLDNWHNVPILGIWEKQWKAHVAVSFITILMTVTYFSPVLLTVVRTYADNSPNLEAKNCSLPFV